MLHLSLRPATRHEVVQLLLLSRKSLLHRFGRLLLVGHNRHVERNLLSSILCLHLLLDLLSKCRLIVLRSLLLRFLHLSVDEPEVAGGVSEPQDIVVLQSLPITLPDLVAIQVAPVHGGQVNEVCSLACRFTLGSSCIFNLNHSMLLGDTDVGYGNWVRGIAADQVLTMNKVNPAIGLEV